MQPKTDSFGDKGDNMKGKTIIELKDVRSGKVQRVEHGNTFQSAVLEGLFKPLGSLGGTVISNACDQWTSLVGGILVFDDTIDVGTKYPPSSINMVANGAYGVQNNTDPVELGTWNESESYVSANEIVMTYDYSTSQGNGRINSVCLTSQRGGVMGIGNASQTTLSQGSRVRPYIGETYMPRLIGEAYGCTDGQYYYILNKSGVTITVKKRWANITGIDLIKGASANTYDETYTLTLPSDYSSISFQYAPYPLQIMEAKIAFIVNKGSNYGAIVVDVANRSVSNEITIPKLGSAIMISGTYPLQVAQVHTNNDISYTSIYDSNTGQWIADYETSGWNIDTCLKIGDRYYFRDASTSCWVTPNNGKLAPTNSRWLIGEYVGSGAYLPVIDKIQQGNDYGSLDRDIAIPSMYLATINNLESEIVKDNTKTMKITYVLTRR